MHQQHYFSIQTAWSSDLSQRPLEYTALKDSLPCIWTSCSSISFYIMLTAQNLLPSLEPPLVLMNTGGIKPILVELPRFLSPIKVLKKLGWKQTHLYTSQGRCQCISASTNYLFYKGWTDYLFYEAWGLTLQVVTDGGSLHFSSSASWTKRIPNF